MKQMIRVQNATPESDSPASNPSRRLGEGRLGQLQWSGRFAVDWEILAYKKKFFWEACFFKWDIDHEHVKARSLDEARSKAQRRIRILEGDRIQRTARANVGLNRANISPDVGHPVKIATA